MASYCYNSSLYKLSLSGGLIVLSLRRSVGRVLGAGTSGEEGASSGKLLDTGEGTTKGGVGVGVGIRVGGGVVGGLLTGASIGLSFL